MRIDDIYDMQRELWNAYHEASNFGDFSELVRAKYGLQISQDVAAAAWVCIGLGIRYERNQQEEYDRAMKAGR
jgi:hypothetical protein